MGHAAWKNTAESDILKEKITGQLRTNSGVGQAR